MEIKYSYKPVPTIKKFSQSEKFIRGLMGPFGSGKSSGCVMELLKRAQRQTPGKDGIRRTRWAVIRNTYPQLRDTTIRTVHDWLPPGIFGDYKAQDHTYLINGFAGVELELLFRALDRPEHVSNLLSLELTGAWVNEAREVPRAIIDALQGRVGRYPAKKDGGPSWYGILMDTNPPDTDSWWYKLFEEIKPDNCEVFKQPSGLLSTAENLDNLVPGYYTNLAQGKDDDFIQVYIKGEYGYVQDGKPVYPEYSDSIHCKDVEPLARCLIWRGWDFGLTPSCVFTQMLPNGQFVILDELTSDSVGIDRFSDYVISHSSIHYQDFDFADVGDPAGEQRSQTDEKTCFQILHAKGVKIEAGLQTLAMRIESVKKPLNQMVSGKPGFLINPKCKMLRKGFQGAYRYKRLQTSSERFTETPEKNDYSHPHDALQYVATKLFGSGLTSRRNDAPLIYPNLATI